MNLVFFAHPSFIGHQSMPRFARMLSDGMARRGHDTQIWSPEAVFSKMDTGPFLKKWFGYIDQYILFPRKVRRKIKQLPKDTLYVFTDQALGPWIPPFAKLPHAIHCHDFMALQSALGQFPENQVGWTGKLYQKLIRRGFSKGQHFISVSDKTKNDLQQFLQYKPKSSDVVYNGFHQPFEPNDEQNSRSILSERTGITLNSGYILHVGGNLWYKNRSGVIDIYNAWRGITNNNVPLLLIGEPPSAELVQKQMSSPYATDIHWLINIEDKFIRYAYSGATVFLFPSLGEGFGWPIAEAMASGSPVITTDEAPMSEVAGGAAFLISRKPADDRKASAWASNAAICLDKVMTLSPDKRYEIRRKGIENAKRFDTQKALDKIESIYSNIIIDSKSNLQ